MFATDVRTICWRQVVAARSLISCQKFKEELLPPPILLHTSSEEEKGQRHRASAPRDGGSPDDGADKPLPFLVYHLYILPTCI